ncbi:MAG TPA: hypothetical protein VIB38_02940 [Aestuariivirgaceae bacterium]|jgi:hypothetical protein
MKASVFPIRIAVGTLSMATVSALVAIGWTASSAAQQGAARTPFLSPSISINALMVAVVDDIAHNVWDGGNKDAPLTAQEWNVVDEHSYQLQAVATLVSLGGTGEADRGWTVSPAWQEWSRKLRDAGVAVKGAAYNKSQMALRSAGDALLDVCEGCHKEFKPDVPTEGRMHVGHGPILR